MLGDNDIAVGLRDGLTQNGYSSAAVADARYVLYVAESRSGESDVDAAVRTSMELVDLVRGLAGRDESHPVTLWIVTRGVREGSSDAAVAQSPLWGTAGVIRAEQPQLWGGLVDLPDGVAVGSLVPALAPMLRTPAKSIVSLRDGEFFAPGLAPVSGAPVREPLRCRPDAAYLITGGLGALGLLTAGWLADRGARRVILAGRTALPPRRDWDSDRRRRHRGEDQRRPRAGGARGGGRSRRARRRFARGDAGAADQTRRRGRGADPRRRPRRGHHRCQAVHRAGGRPAAAHVWPRLPGRSAAPGLPAGKPRLHVPDRRGRRRLRGAGPGRLRRGECLPRRPGAEARNRQGCYTVSQDWVAWRGLGFGAEAQIALAELERLGSRAISADEAFAAWEHLSRFDVAQAVMAPMAPISATAVGRRAARGDPGLVRDGGRGRAQRIADRLAGHSGPRAAPGRGRSRPATGRSRNTA